MNYTALNRRLNTLLALVERDPGDSDQQLLALSSESLAAKLALAANGVLHDDFTEQVARIDRESAHRMAQLSQQAIAQFNRRFGVQGMREALLLKLSSMSSEATNEQ